MSDAVLTPLGRALIGSLPPILRNSLSYKAVCHVLAKEAELLESRFEEVRLQFWPKSADTLLHAWEVLLRLPPDPVGLTTAQRRTLIEANLAKLSGDPAGSSWVANVTDVIGPGWTYREHVPGDGTSPPPYTIRILLPFGPTTMGAYIAETYIRDITPAHLDLEISYSAGFVLDRSQLDQEVMHY